MRQHCTQNRDINCNYGNMKRSIFDSNSEKNLFRKIDSRWSKYVEVYPQIPVRNVISYHQIKSLGAVPVFLDTELG